MDLTPVAIALHLEVCAQCRSDDLRRLDRSREQARVDRLGMDLASGIEPIEQRSGLALTEVAQA
jgi:hypothetical protein